MPESAWADCQEVGERRSRHVMVAGKELITYDAFVRPDFDDDVLPIDAICGQI